MAPPTLVAVGDATYEAGKTKVVKVATTDEELGTNGTTEDDEPFEAGGFEADATSSSSRRCSNEPQPSPS